MAQSQPATDGGDVEPDTETTFEDALAAARDVAAYGDTDCETTVETILPAHKWDSDTLPGAVINFTSPRNTVLRAFLDEGGFSALVDEDDDEDDEAEPDEPAPADREPRTFDFEPPETEDDDTTFIVSDEYVNRYEDLKAVIETPPPWETPDDMTPANEVIKQLDWEETHRTFDEDRGAWTLDAGGDELEQLEQLATDAGYSWRDARGREAPENDLDEAAKYARDGDRVTLTYAKKNGNGEGSVSGTVEYAEGVERTIVLRRDDGHVNRAKPDDHRTPAVFSGGYHPFMGELLRVDVEPGAGED